MKNGLKIKYKISKIDGSPIAEDAEYFVLRLDKDCKDVNHLIACRKAVRTYAKEIQPYLPELSKDLEKRYNT